LPEVGLLALVPEAWGGMWLSRHQLLTRLTRYFNVLWCNPPRHWRDAWSGLRVTERNADPTRPPSHGFTIYDHAAWYPRFYGNSPWQRFTAAGRLRDAHRVLKNLGCSQQILYVWLPDYADALDLAPHDVSCYHIVDEYSFSDVETPLSDVERRLIERVDQVFIHSPALWEKKGRINPRTDYVTNGVDFAAFAAPSAEPADLAAVPHPRIGYIGRLKSQLDWELLHHIARERPAWSLVLVGPTGHMGEAAATARAVLDLPNVHHLGNKALRDIPAYTRHMDVCVLCYARTDYTKYIFPLKLHEYLASGKPVVGSDIRSLHEFANVVRIAHSPDEWVSAIEEALTPAMQTPERVAERQRVARAFDWDVLAERIAMILCERLGPEYAQRLRVASEGGAA
jgi:glycosyltransferase involved in cell wall biosynthesis